MEALEIVFWRPDTGEQKTTTVKVFIHQLCKIHEHNPHGWFVCSPKFPRDHHLVDRKPTASTSHLPPGLPKTHSNCFAARLATRIQCDTFEAAVTAADEVAESVE